MNPHYDYLIVGAGISGITIAERISSQLGKSCLIVEKRNHIGGNCYDFYDSQGVLIHKYGPHFFRTNSEEIKSYISQFTEWLPVNYNVLSYVDGRHYFFPINLNTFEQIIGKPSTEEEMKAKIEEWRIPIENPQNSEEVIISQVGEKLYEMFFKNYTIKQWKMHPRDLDASVCGRIPIRTNRNNSYVDKKFQAIPKEGYTAMFEQMLDSAKNVNIILNTDFEQIRDKISYDKLIYTGMIDTFYQYRFGKLPYRSIDFKYEYHHCDFYQKAVQINYPNDYDYTRIIEIKHITKQKIKGTTITKEYPTDYTGSNEAFYPIPSSSSQEILEKYRNLAKEEKNILFLGRLGMYKYYDMDQVFGMALSHFKEIQKRQ